MACRVFLGMLLLASPMGCDRAQAPAEESGPKRSSDGTGLVRLPPEQLTQSGVTVEPVGRMAFRTYRDFPGTIKPNENALAEITALVRGRVVEVNVDLGKNVRAGERLALLYSQELGLTQSAFLTAQARLNVAEQAFARATFLLKEKVIGKGEFQRREGDLVSARAQTKEAKNHLKLLGMTDEDIAAVGRTQEIRSSIPIVAPFAGRVIHRNVRAGEVVETMQKLFALADLSTVWVLADVPEKDIGFVQYRGDDSGSVEVQVSAYPGQLFRGKVVYRGDVLDAATRTMRVRVEVSNSDGRLKPEMYATVRVVSKPEPDAITIPKAAVQQDHGESVVFVRVNEQEFGRRVIHIAEQNDKHVHVLDGLTEGEEIVVVGAYMLKSELARQQEGAVGD
ncbi:MAG: efflux RND transporter periplasmic adaptor subunit [Nitrospirota bacterium]|nr:efflux RND transporter periplasmic adaptor subunit [Nitrospirota bacterium]